MTIYYKQIFIGILLLLITACGGGGSNLADSGPGTGGTGTGTGGTGSGTGGTGTGGTGIAVISGFSSVILNTDRIFDVDANTQLFIDDSPVSLAQLQARGLGMTARFDVATDVNNSISSGTLLTLRAGNQVVGPVTSTAPLQVLGQTVVATGDTVLVDVPGAEVANIALNEVVEVSGFDNASNIILATRIQRQAAGVAVWRIRGTIYNVNLVDGTFAMGAQLINLNGVVPRNCGAGLANGDSVEVKVAPDPAFTAGNLLDTVTDVECINFALNLPSDAVGNIIEAEVEGIVTGFSSVSDFEILEQRVVTTTGTVFEGGTALDVAQGVRLEAEGTLDITTGILTVERIRFRQIRFEIEAPLNVPSGGLKTLGSTFTVLDVITVNLTALTEDPDGLVDGSGASGLLQVEIEGHLDASNRIIADSVELESNTADLSEIEVHGPLSNPVYPVFELLGVTVDTTNSELYDLDGSQQLSPAAFFDKITPGTIVEVEDAVFTPGSPPVLSGGSIEIED